jgi:hypothetical protein
MGSDTFLQVVLCLLPSAAEKNLAKARVIGIPQAEN